MSYSDSSTWVLVKTERERRPLLIRFRQFPGGLPRATYSQRISIVWKLSDPDENGLPSDEEFDKLAAFEDRVMAAVEHDQHSIFTVMLSGNGESEFVFYTADVPGFIERLRSMPQEVERHPISIHQYDDSNWTYFEAVIPENCRDEIRGKEQD
ncbi:MAG TPA: DUF695 domain-containing protein [Pyrinomonadaceae bacterium]